MNEDISDHGIIINSEQEESTNLQLISPENSDVTKSKPISKKVRKPQTDQGYQEQKRQFYTEGPTLNTDNWLLENDICALSVDKKTDRASALHACEKAYFIKDYQRCLEIIKNCEVLFGVELQDSQDKVKNEFEQSGRKVKKSNKVERHVVELMHIKERCLAKLNE